MHETIASSSTHIACLQETKLHTIDATLAKFLGAYRLNHHAYKPAFGTRGGILLLWNENIVTLSDISIGRFSITALVTVRHSATSFILTTIYRSSRHQEKVAFLQHICAIKLPDETKWLITGDFNLIYRVRDKNNNIHLQLMRSVRVALNHCELKEIHLQNKKFTWSNERCRSISYT